MLSQSGKFITKRSVTEICDRLSDHGYQRTILKTYYKTKKKWIKVRVIFRQLQRAQARLDWSKGSGGEGRRGQTCIRDNWAKCECVRNDKKTLH